MNYLFDKNWFQKKQRILLWLLNTPLIKIVFRWIMRIHKYDCPLKIKITEITPNSFSWGDRYFKKKGKWYLERTTDFRTHNKYSKRLFYTFYLVWYLFHILDWIILDRELFPALNMVVRNKLISLSTPSAAIRNIKNPVAFRAKINPVRNFSSIFFRFISKMNAVFPTFKFSAFFTKFRIALSPLYSFVKSTISNIITFPIHILFSKSPDILFTSNPRFMTHTVFITHKTFRNFYFGIKRLFKIFFSPFKIAFTRAIFSIDVVWESQKLFITNFTKQCIHRILSILIIDLSFSMSTLTVYPDADPETTTVDGYIQNSNAVFATSRDATVGTSSSDSATQSVAPQCSFANGTYYIDRGFLLFDTSSIPDDNTVTNAIISLWHIDIGNGGDVDGDSVHFVSSSPASNTAIVLEDFDQIGSVSFGSYDLTVVFNAYTDTNLNSSGLANISKTGVSKFATRVGGDLNNIAPTGLNQQTIYFAEQTGTANDPKLVVTYLLPTTGNFFQMF